jgi:predicted dehydrogenase
MTSSTRAAIRVAILGASHWHAPRYLEYSRAAGARLVGVSDLDLGVARRVAESVGCTAYPDGEALVSGARPDFVIALPRHDRALDEVAPLLRRGVSLLVEKPLGVSGAQARRLANLAERHGGFVAVCFPNRHLTFWEEIESLRASGKLGTPIDAHFRIINGPPTRYVTYGVPWMLDPARSGGGAFRNLGIHGLDAFLQLAGGPAAVAVRGAAVTNAAYGLPIEECGCAVLQAGDRLVGTVEASYSYASSGGDQEWRLAATGAHVVDRNGTLSVVLADGTSYGRPARPPADVYRRLVEDTFDRFRRGDEPGARLAACADASELLDRCYEMAGVAVNPPAV